MAGQSSSMFGVWVGYGIIFGAANGFGYGFGLQMSAQASPGREGLAMGIVTAFYALGAFGAPPIFSWVVDLGGFQWAMYVLAAALILILPICMLLLMYSGGEFQAEESDPTIGSVSIKLTALLWLGYGTAVAAGLMAIGHATGIASSAGLKSNLWLAPMIIAIFNMAGSFIFGWLADRMRPDFLLSGLALVSAIALMLLSMIDGISFALFGLGVVGLTYGALIAAYPAVISKLFGVLRGVKIYGRVFTAWGTAGLLAPSFAAVLYDSSGSYSVALFVAAALGVISALTIMPVMAGAISN